MKILTTLTGALAIAFSSSAIAKPKASHSIEEFQSILSGKVIVMSMPLWQIPEEDKKKPSIAYLASDGTKFSCSLRPTKENKDVLKYNFNQGRKKWDKWKLTKPFFSSGVLLTTNGNDTRSIPIYDEKTNTLERWYKRNGKWQRLVVAYLQDSWPAWALEKCPGLKLPEGLKINQEQKTPDYQQNYETHDLTLNNEQSSLDYQDPKEAYEFLVSNDGNILKDSDGKRYLFNYYKSEFWKLNNNLDAVDVAKLRTAKQDLQINWKYSGKKQTYRYGTKMSLTATDKRHPAFLFRDWLIAQESVDLKLSSSSKYNYIFEDEQKVSAGNDNGVRHKGLWWYEGNMMFASFTTPGGTTGTDYLNWKEVAKQTSWPGNEVN